jgi:hypothetical protein
MLFKALVVNYPARVYEAFANRNITSMRFNINVDLDVGFSSYIWELSYGNLPFQLY